MAGNPRLRKLKALERQLRAALKGCDAKELAALARQYREKILAGREADGKPGAVRKNRS